MLNTKQVRAVAKLVTNVSASYTDKTIKKDKTNKRRSIVFIFRNTRDANALADFLRSNIPNKVTQTGRFSAGEIMHGTSYVRVKADIA